MKCNRPSTVGANTNFLLGFLEHQNAVVVLKHLSRATVFASFPLDNVGYEPIAIKYETPLLMHDSIAAALLFLPQPDNVVMKIITDKSNVIFLIIYPFICLTPPTTADL